MAGLVPAIHVLEPAEKDVDARVEPAHDEERKVLLFNREQL